MLVVLSLVLISVMKMSINMASYLLLPNKKGVQNRRFWRSIARDARRIAGIASRSQGAKRHRTPSHQQLKYNDPYWPCFVPAFGRYINGQGAKAVRRRMTRLLYRIRVTYLQYLFYFTCGALMRNESVIDPPVYLSDELYSSAKNFGYLVDLFMGLLSEGDTPARVYIPF